LLIPYSIYISSSEFVLLQVGTKIYSEKTQLKETVELIAKEKQNKVSNEKALIAKQDELIQIESRLREKETEIGHVWKELEAAKQKVQALEGQIQKHTLEADVLSQSLEKETRTLQSLTQKIKSHEQNAMLAEKALAIKQKSAQESMKLLNPLNHPILHKQP